jgi:predicted Fe-S protein YdhL (DUF1289 family)
MRRYQRFQQLPPAQRQRVLNNYRRWQQMTPDERQETRRQLNQMKPNPNHPARRRFWHLW